MIEDNPDYITVLPAINRKGNTSVSLSGSITSRRRLHHTRVSQPLKKVAADALALSWATALQVEIR